MKSVVELCETFERQGFSITKSQCHQLGYKVDDPEDCMENFYVIDAYVNRFWQIMPDGDEVYTIAYPLLLEEMGYLSHKNVHNEPVVANFQPQPFRTENNPLKGNIPKTHGFRDDGSFHTYKSSK